MLPKGGDRVVRVAGTWVLLVEADAHVLKAVLKLGPLHPEDAVVLR